MADEHVPTWGNMFEFPKVYLDAIKMVGTGNAAGILAVLAGVGSPVMRPELLPHLKVVGFFFFCGLNLSLAALIKMYSHFMQYSHSVHAHYGWRDQLAAQNWFATSLQSLNSAYRCTQFSLGLFLGGMSGGVVLFMRV
jgi:hypothetical protein